MTEQVARSHADLEDADRRADERPGSGPRPARRTLPHLHLAARSRQHRPDLRFGAPVLPSTGLRPGDDLPGRSRGRGDPGRARCGDDGGGGRPDGPHADGRGYPGRRRARGPAASSSPTRRSTPVRPGGRRPGAGSTARSSSRWSATRCWGRSRSPPRDPRPGARGPPSPGDPGQPHGPALAGLKQAEEIRRLNQSLEQHADELVKSEAALASRRGSSTRSSTA